MYKRILMITIISLMTGIFFLLNIPSVSASSINQQVSCYDDRDSADRYCLPSDNPFDFKIKALYFDSKKKMFYILPKMQIDEIYVKLPREDMQSGALIKTCITDDSGSCSFKGYGNEFTGTFEITKYGSYVIDARGNSDFLSSLPQPDIDPEAMLDENFEFPTPTADQEFLYLVTFEPGKTYYLVFYDNQSKYNENDWQWTLYSKNDFGYTFSNSSKFGNVPSDLLSQSNVQDANTEVFYIKPSLVPTSTPEIVRDDAPVEDISPWGMVIFFSVLVIVIIIAVIIYNKIKKIDKEWRP